jgi:methyl-accepting chemotaxis protein
MAVSSNGHGGDALDHGLLKDEAMQITGAVSRIVEMTDQVSEGAEVQIRSLDSALSGLNEMSASLKETATQGVDL